MPPRVPQWRAFAPPLTLKSSMTRSLNPSTQSTGYALPQPSRTTIRTIKSTNTPRPDRFAHRPSEAPLSSTSTAALKRKEHSTPTRTGLVAQKRGMTAIYDPDTGKRSACTVLQIDRNEVIAHKTREKNGYWAVQIGAGEKQVDNVSRPMLGHFAAAGVAPKRWVYEFKVKGKEGLGVEVGERLGASWFQAGQWVDVRGVSRGMGFEGVSSDIFFFSLGLKKRVVPRRVSDRKTNNKLHTGHEKTWLWRPTRISWSVAHASRYGFLRRRPGFWIPCVARQTYGRKYGQRACHCQKSQGFAGG